MTVSHTQPVSGAPVEASVVWRMAHSDALDGQWCHTRPYNWNNSFITKWPSLAEALQLRQQFAPLLLCRHTQNPKLDPGVTILRAGGPMESVQARGAWCWSTCHRVAPQKHFTHKGCDQHKLSYLYTFTVSILYLHPSNPSPCNKKALHVCEVGTKCVFVSHIKRTNPLQCMPRRTLLALSLEKGLGHSYSYCLCAAQVFIKQPSHTNWHSTALVLITEYLIKK